MKKTLFYLLVVVLLVACAPSRSVPAASSEVPFVVAPTLALLPSSVPATAEILSLPTATIVPALPTPLPSAVPLNATNLPAHDAVLEVTTLPSGDLADQVAIKMPGDVRTTIYYFPKSMTGVQFQRLVCDDNCNSVTIVYPDGTVKDLRPHFAWISFPAGGTGDAAIDAVLVARGLNINDGETLSQNTNAIWLGNVPAGTYIVVVAQDDPTLMINVGVAYIRFVTTSDSLTIDVATIPAN